MDDISKKNIEDHFKQIQQSQQKQSPAGPTPAVNVAKHDEVKHDEVKHNEPVKHDGPVKQEQIKHDGPVQHQPEKHDHLLNHNQPIKHEEVKPLTAPIAHREVPMPQHKDELPHKEEAHKNISQAVPTADRASFADSSSRAFGPNEASIRAILKDGGMDTQMIERSVKRIKELF